jgi:hypothetical protein
MESLGAQVLHAMGAGRPRLLAHRRHRHSDDREGAQHRHPEHLCAQGPAFRSPVVRALDLRRPGRGQRAVGVRLHLVRLPAGPDPGVPHLPDLERIPGEVRLRSDDPAAAGAHLRAQRRTGVRPSMSTKSPVARRLTRSAGPAPPTRPIRTSSPSGRRPGRSSCSCAPRTGASRGRERRFCPQDGLLPAGSGLLKTVSRRTGRSCSVAEQPRYPGNHLLAEGREQCRMLLACSPVRSRFVRRVPIDRP